MKPKVKAAPKTVRFDALVETSGRPEPVTLWTKPEDDRAFMRAVREQRVATLVQANVGTKKDFGLVGFAQRENASYLVFPKPISYPPESKIVGLKYDRLSTSSAKGPPYKPRPAAKPGIPMREKPRFVLENENPAAQTTGSKANTKPKRQEGARSKAKEPAKVRMRTFSATVVLTAVQKVRISVEAESSDAAQTALRAEAANVEMNLADAKVTRNIKKG